MNNMNKIWLLGAVCMVLAFGSCKPKQSAYKAAYEQAKEKEPEAVIDVSDVTARTERIKAAEGEDAGRLKRFSVVIGSFQNKTNAYSLKERMENEGYRVVLGENEQGMLRVIVSSFDERWDAASERDIFKSKYAPNFQDAWLLERAY
ncbi:cell division protein FtsN [Bacteroidales bacterium Barb6]|nr:cell division protein FtsN [Bacteroidales bacterium Barb6]